MKLNLHLVRVFHQVIESQSFSRAAEKLFISQPAVSKAIRELESQLGLTLIERNLIGTKRTRSINLTSDGEALFAHARAIFALERAAIEDLQSRIELKQGKLTVGASSTVASYWIASYVTYFHQHYPDIELRIEVGNTESMRQALIDCHIDLALVEGEVIDPRIIKTVWQDEELVIIVPPEASLSWTDLVNQQWLVREQGSGTYREAEKMLEQLAINPLHRLTIASNEGIARMVACGAGVAILPLCIVQDLVSLKQLKILDVPMFKTLSRSLFLLTLKERPVTKLQKSFIDCLHRSSNKTNS